MTRFEISVSGAQTYTSGYKQKPEVLIRIPCDKVTYAFIFKTDASAKAFADDIIDLITKHDCIGMTRYY